VAFLAGKESTQEEFFHTFNTLYNDSKQIVLTSDRPPKEIPTLEERLRSRFEWGLLVDVQAPDFETRVAILKKKVETNNIYISDDVIEYVATNVTNNIRNLEGALIKLLAFAGLTGSEISLDMASEVLSSVFQTSPVRAATIADAMNVSCEHYRVTIDQLKSKRRTQDLVLARQVAMYLAREKVGVSLNQIGRAFGNRDHTTVLHACHKIKGLIDEDPRFRGTIKDLFARF
jgi:chromosomal replication initiator protein